MLTPQAQASTVRLRLRKMEWADNVVEVRLYAIVSCHSRFDQHGDLTISCVPQGGGREDHHERPDLGQSCRSPKTPSSCHSPLSGIKANAIGGWRVVGRDEYHLQLLP